MSAQNAIHLAKLQADFQAYLYDNVKGAAFKAQIVNDQKVGAKKRLSIYYDAYRLRIIGVLANDYPNLKKYLGDDLFERTARSYINQYPSTYCNMRWVGGQMARHLQKTLRQHPVAAELAQFEWALGLAFDAEDAPILQLTDLAAIPPENWGDIVLKLHPSVQLLAFKHNAIMLWQALNSAQTPPNLAKLNAPCIVWRKALDSHYRSIDALEMRAIEKVMAGTTFAELCEFLQAANALENSTEDAAIQQAAQFLSNWLADGLILGKS
jgi:hypothetical protein